ncbi:hypothetical protein [Dyella lutea]|uniref:Uncharacterized protein n=1 Tax=Dyella lutea TaxID=2950441 RepID=A0ABT1FAS0_9GAMM|nr:hypothetical protein [Dyella lutea]MCP1374475.1 hypothetical protein [Dyella lutea]
MSTRLKTAAALIALGLVAVTASQGARACALGDMHPWNSSRWATPPSQAGHPAAGPQGSRTSTNLLQSLVPITGLYRFTFTSRGNSGIPDGAVIDQGFEIWHADGTEIMNSGRPPMTQSFCMGAWAQTGPRSYHLNHWALSWDATGTSFVGPTNIREDIKQAASGNAFSGSFSIDQYGTDGNTLLGSVKGTVSATRVTADAN